MRKLLKHKELDFSQIKPIPAIEQNSRLKQIIEQAMKERLTDAINRKDLNDVKKLVEGNCFINRAIITDVLRNVNEPIHYLNEKFPATVEQSVTNTNIQKDFEQFVRELVNGLERTKAQLAEKEQELNRVVSERTRDTNEISQLERDFSQQRLELQTQNQDLNNKNRKLSEASIYNRRQSNYASGMFKKVCQTEFLVQLNFQPIRKKDIKLRYS